MPTLVTDPGIWNSALASLPLAHVLQTWEWGQFKSRHGWMPQYLLWQDPSGRPCAAALVLRRRLSRLPWPLLYVPKGPALDYADVKLAGQVLGDLQTLARRSRAILIKIDPDWTPNSSDVARAQGWAESSEQVQFRNTMEIDLRRGEDELLAAMHQKTRYNIRLAAKRGVSVRPGGAADIETLYAMYVETARRDRFIIRPFEYYKDAWGSFLETGLAQPLLAEVAGEPAPVAALILFRFARRAYYFYGMSRDAHRDKMPNHLLQWEAMRWARAQNCIVYDMWGAPDHLAEDDPLWGVYRFKQGFGGQFVEHAGAWDWPASRPLAWLYTRAMPRILDVMRRRHWSKQGPPGDLAS